MEWSEEDVLKLIGLYQTKSLLWDPKHKDHMRKNLKEDSWREIGAEMNMCPDKCKKKMVSLLGSYRREKSKVKSSKGTGKGADEIYVSRWYAHEAFAFLEDRDLPREGLTTETDEAPIIADNIEEEVMPTEQMTTQATTSFLTPPPTKRAKGRREDTNVSVMNSAFDILKTAVTKFDKKPSDDNEIVALFNYVSAKMQKYSPETQKGVQHAVFDIIMKADRGMFDWPAVNYQNAGNWPNPAGSGHTPPMYYQTQQAVPLSADQQRLSLPQQSVPPPVIRSLSEPSLSSNSTQQSSKQGRASSLGSENFDDFV